MSLPYTNHAIFCSKPEYLGDESRFLSQLAMYTACRIVCNTVPVPHAYHHNGYTANATI